MARTIEVSIAISAPIDAVWNDLAKVQTHSEWMRDAEAIEFLSDSRQGVGTTIRVPTRIGPLRTVDVIEFTEWDPPHRMGIAHRGLFLGTGAITLDESAPAGTTTVTWSETVVFPLRFGGRVGALVAAPILRLVWRSNLKRLAGRFR